MWLLENTKHPPPPIIKNRRKGANPLFEILGEDDGNLFSYDYPIKFDLHWTDGLIKQLEDAKKYWDKIKDTYNYNEV